MANTVLKISDLYDNYNDYLFGYIAIDIETGKVELYSDDNRRNEKSIYKISPKDKDFYWEFYHNGDYIRHGIETLTDSSLETFKKLRQMQMKYANQNGYSVDGFKEKCTKEKYTNIAFYRGNYNTSLKTDKPIYDILNNCIYLPYAHNFIEQEDWIKPPTSAEIAEYKYLVSEVENYYNAISNMTQEQKKEFEKKYKDNRDRLLGKEMQKVKMYLEDPNSVKKFIKANEDALLFGLGQLRCSSIELNSDSSITLKAGFYEEKLHIDSYEHTKDCKNFIIPSKKYSFMPEPNGMALELIFNDLECREMNPNYKSVISKTYGPLLDYITEGKLRKARYNGGIEEYYEIMCDIIPDRQLAQDLLNEMDYNNNSEEEIYKILTRYAEAKIELLDLSKMSLYHYCKDCNKFGLGNIGQQGKNFEGYVDNNPEIRIAMEMFNDLISINTNSGSKLKFRSDSKKISRKANEIIEYANSQPNSFVFQILKIFATKYLKRHKNYYIGRNISVGAMTQLSLCNIYEEQTYERDNEGRLYLDMHGKTRKEISNIEDKFAVFLPTGLKEALLGNDVDKMILEITKAFGSHEKRSRCKTMKNK